MDCHVVLWNFAASKLLPLRRTIGFISHLLQTEFDHCFFCAASVRNWTGCKAASFVLQALAKYAFGLGTITMLATTAAFTLFALPVGKGIGTRILVDVFHASPKLAGIRSVDEAIVIGAALSLSSSAFVLQLMSEKGQLATKFGSAVLGILLLQVQSYSVAYLLHLGTLTPTIY